MRDHVQADIDKVLEHERKQWESDYVETVTPFLRTHETFQGGELKAYCILHGLRRPHHHNVWGGMVQALARVYGLTEKIGEEVPDTPHTHIDRVGVWRSLIYDPLAVDGPSNLRVANGLDDPRIAYEEGDPHIELVEDLAGFRHILRRMECEASDISLDFETTGLDPETAKVRLAQLDWGSGTTYVIDFWKLVPGMWGDDTVGMAELAKATVTYEAFNAKFEAGFFRARGHHDVVVNDVMHYRMAVEGGGQMSFAKVVGQDLLVELSKTEQISNWAQDPLTPEQLRYAGLDAYYNTKLADHWILHMDGGHDACFDLLNSQIDPSMEMQAVGLGMDIDRHAKLVSHWKELEQAYISTIREAVTVDEIANPGSRTQWSDFLIKWLSDEWIAAWPKTEKSGQLQITNDTLKRCAVVSGEGIFADTLYAVADLFTVRQYLGNFGDKLINLAKADPLHRIHPRFNIGAARTLRYSCSSPNAQQLPRDRELLGEHTSVRSSFIAGPGRHLITIDYSGIELRVLALLSGDKQLLEDCVEGDVHLEVGSLMAGRRLDKSIAEDKAIRSNAKGVSFGIIYGSGAVGLAATMRSSLSFAEEMLANWEARYPKAFALRHTVMEEAEDAPDPKNRRIRMHDGGTINMGKRADLPKCANYPVQRTAWTVMARAIARHYDSLAEGYAPGTDMCATIHDAMIDEAPEEIAEEALETLAYDMEKAYLDVFPGAPTARLMEGGHGPCWGEIKDDVV